MIKKDGGISSESSSAQRKANEAKQAFVLFIIVLLYFICHTPRFLINVHEFFNLDILKAGMEGNCDSFPVWALACTSVSHCLMTLNSSSNFYIYCFMCSTFRDVLRQWVLRFCKFCSCLCCSQIHTLFSRNENGTTNNSKQIAVIGLSTVETHVNANQIKETDVNDSHACIVHDISCRNESVDKPEEISQTKTEEME